MQSATSFSTFVTPFAAKIKTIDAASMPISNYSKSYLGHIIIHHLYYLTIYANMLDNVLQHSTKTAAQIALADYGAGNGMLGIFAKYCGFKKVFICDMDADFVQASKLLAAQLNIYIDDFITGNIQILQQAVVSQTIDAVAGSDVIEHIYSLDNFFGSIKKINPAMVTVFTTASNPANFIKNRHLKKLQRKDELHGSYPQDFIIKGEEKHEAFIKIREKIITENFTQITKNDVIKLSAGTRGLDKADILSAVNIFLQTGKMPVPDVSSANTCNPITGSFTERILLIKQYTKIYTAQGFSLQVKNGFYNSFTPGFKKYINLILNIIVKLTGKTTAPFITLIGYKSL